MGIKAESFIIYQGPSLIDGSPIVAIAQSNSGNRKTGDMVQTYIIRADIDPITASRTGADKAICGDCMHKGKPSNKSTGQALERTCYVTLAHGPLQKYKGFIAGKYPVANGHDKIRAIGLGRMVRLGTYGDPCAVPSFIWTSLISAAQGWTAYTHGATNPMPDHIMTSADSLSQAESAWNRGERTFRVIAALSDIAKGKEVLCPASEEAGKRATCESCKLCAGASVKGKSVAIVAHGTSKNKAKQLIASNETESNKWIDEKIGTKAEVEMLMNQQPYGQESNK